ncbi:hypothetical protein IWX85_003123 [Polaromonas sp. CG_9.11]|nr:hypothetical protein [Polaromonas sp. CG_9.11]
MIWKWNKNLERIHLKMGVKAHKAAVMRALAARGL